jgi:hypothetical protein
MVTGVSGSIRSKPKLINDQLREAIWGGGKSFYRLGLETGVSPKILDRFAAQKQDILMETAAKIADSLGLELRARSETQAT